MYIIIVLLNKVFIYVCGGVICLIVIFCLRFFYNMDLDKFLLGYCLLMKSVIFIILFVIIV